MSNFEIHIWPTLESKDSCEAKSGKLNFGLVMYPCLSVHCDKRTSVVKPMIWHRYILRMKKRMMWDGKFDFRLIIYPCLSVHVHCDKRTYEKKSAVRPMIWHRYILKICEKENDVRCTFGWHHYTPPFLTWS
jgi:hypothetical protein